MRKVLARGGARRYVAVCILAGAAILWQAIASSTFAAPVGYSFSVSISFVTPTGPPYGVPITTETPFSGHFFYDPNVSAVSPNNGTDTSIYPQTISGGFTATIGGLSLSTDTYAIQVYNNVSNKDEVQIIYSNNLTAARPADPLIVNGTAYTVGDFEIDLIGSTSLLSSSALPTSLTLSSFTSKQTYLGHAGFPGPIDLIGSVTSLPALPVMPADLNRDGNCDASDIAAMMQMLADPTTYETTHDLTNDDLLTLGDLNHSRSIDNADLQYLLNTLCAGGPSATAVPEPDTFGLLAIAACLQSVFGCRRMKAVTAIKELEQDSSPSGRGRGEGA